MEWNTETQRHRVLFFERTEFTEKRFAFAPFVFYIFLRVFCAIYVNNKKSLFIMKKKPWQKS